MKLSTDIRGPSESFIFDPAISYKGVFQIIEMRVGWNYRLKGLTVYVRGENTHWFCPSTDSYVGTKEECEVLQERSIKNKMFNDLSFQKTINGSNNDLY